MRDQTAVIVALAALTIVLVAVGEHGVLNTPWRRSWSLGPQHDPGRSRDRGRGWPDEHPHQRDVDDTGRVWNYHYVGVYATIAGQRAVRIRVDKDDTPRATRPIHERGGSLVSWPARRRFQRRILELYIEDGDSR